MESKKRLFDLFVKEVIFDEKNVLIVLRTYKGAEVTKALQENSLVNPKKAGRTNEYGEELTIEENGVKKILNQTCKRFSLELFGELDGNRAEPPQKPEWFRRFICFSIEKKSTEYLIIPFTGMEININKVYRYK